MSELPELLSFLSLDARLDVKCTALEYVLGLTGSESGRKWIKSNKDVVGRLMDLLSDRDEIISRDAHLALVNLSADQELADCLLSSIPRLLHHVQDPQWTHADELCTVLSNLSRSEAGAQGLFKVLRATENGGGENGDAKQAVGTTLYHLVDIFDRWKSFNKHANFHHMASIFLNLSQIQEARWLFLDQSKCILPKLLPYTHFNGSLIRRGGIAGLVKNLCFEIDHHKWLLSEEVDILPSLLLPLAGSEQFEEEEMEKLPEDLQYLSDNKERDPDPDIRKMLLEALMKLCCTRHGRVHLREKQTYLILRELHKWETEDEVKVAVENVVDLLIADEAEAAGVDNLEEVKAGPLTLSTE